MNYIVIIVFGLIIGTLKQAVAADIKVVSTSFDASYSSATSYNNNYHSKDSIDHAENYGFGIEMKIGVTRTIRINLGFNYTPMKVSEYDPITAWSRNEEVFFSSLYNKLQWYRTAKSTITGKNIFDVTYDYQYHMNYVNYIFAIDIAPLPDSRIQPFLTVGIAPCQFLQRGYFITDVTGRFEDEKGNFAGKWHYRVRTWNDMKQRGFVFNGMITGGLDLMLSKTIGFQVKARYFHALKDHKRNRITGYYNINTGLVFHP